MAWGRLLVEQLVPEPAPRHQPRASSYKMELRAQPTHVNFKRALDSLIAETPHALGKKLSRNDLAMTARDSTQQLKLCWRKPDDLVAECHTIARSVNGKFPQLTYRFADL